jgi:transcriptional regulator with XRE-family HTH domain
VSRLESGREPPSLRSVVALAEALGASLDAIVLVKGEPAKSLLAELPAEVRRLVGASRDLEPRLVRHLTALARAMTRRAAASGGRKPPP